MKTISKTFLALTFSFSFALPALSDIVIIVHPSNDATIDASVAQRLFLGKEKKFSNGKEALPINQSESSSVRSEFDTGTLGRSSTQVSAYWSKLVFTGKGIPPKEVDSDTAVIALISSNENAIGYVNSSAVTPAVKAIPLN